MKGLILKDLLVLKKQAVMLGIFSVIFFAMRVFADEMSMIYIVVLISVAAMLPITAIAYDAQCGWDKYALSAPFSRKQFAIEKYLLGLVLMSAGIVVSVVVGAITSICGKVSFGSTVISVVIAFAAGLLMLSVTLPLTLKFGAEKARLLMILGSILPMMIASAVADNISRMELAPKTVTITVIVGAVLLAVIVALSVVWSCRICEKKDF